MWNEASEPTTEWDNPSSAQASWTDPSTNPNNWGEVVGDPTYGEVYDVDLSYDVDISYDGADYVRPSIWSEPTPDSRTWI